MQVLQQRVPGPRRCGTLTTGPPGNSHPSVVVVVLLFLFVYLFFHLFLLVGG